MLRARKVVYIRAVRAGAVDDAPAFKLSVCSNYLISVVGFFYADNLCIQLYFGSAYGLEIESEPDEGTLVRIRLPLCEDTVEKIKEEAIL